MKPIKHLLLLLAILGLSYSSEAQIKVISNGNVGIGTSSPGAKLDVRGGRVEIPATTDANGNANTGVLEIGNSLRIDGNEVITNTNSTLYIQNDNNGDLVVDGGTVFVDASAGRVGIGVTAPTQKLDVAGNITVNRLYDRNNTGYYMDPASTSITNVMRAHIYYDQGNTAYYLNPAGTSICNSMRANIFYDKGNTGFYVDPASTSVMNQINASIMYDRDNTSYYVNPGGTSVCNSVWANIFYDKGNTGFYVNPASTSVMNQINASIIYDKDNTGYYVNPSSTSKLATIYTNIIYDNNNTAYYCNPSSISRMYYVYPSSNEQGYLGSSSNRWRYAYVKYLYKQYLYTLSDRSLKENIRDIDSPLQKVLALNGKVYDFKDNGIAQAETHSISESDMANPNDKITKRSESGDRINQLGFIAQEVEKVIPNAVQVDEETGLYMMNYEAVIPLLVEAIKEQQKQIDALKAGYSK